MKRMQEGKGAEAPKRTVAQRIEGLMREVREMRRGGDLESLLAKGTGEILRLIQEEALAERAKAEGSGSVGFPPSGLSPVPRGGDARDRTARSDGQDGGRGDRV